MLSPSLLTAYVRGGLSPDIHQTLTWLLINRMEEKKNCWEFMNCDREPNGKNSEALGVCPAASAAMYSGINHGTNGGRFCWVAVGTYSFEPFQGTFAAEKKSCRECPFFKEVKLQEGSDIVAGGM